MGRCFKHKHLQITNHQLSDGGEVRFTRDGHDSVDLASWLCSYAKRSFIDDLSVIQTAALQHFQNERLGDLGEGFKTEIVALQAYIDLFDDLFFFGSLKEKLSIQFHPPPGPDGNIAETNFHYRMKKICRIPLPVCWEGACKLDFFLGESNKRTREETLMLMLGSLLHEMTHAFFLLWSCDYHSCDERFESTGCTGHGLSWQKVTQSIEEGVRILLGFRLSLDRAASLTYELVISGYIISPEELDDVGIGSGAIEWHLEKDAARWKEAWAESRCGDSRWKRFALGLIGITS